MRRFKIVLSFVCLALSYLLSVIFFFPHFLSLYFNFSFSFFITTQIPQIFSKTLSSTIWISRFFFFLFPFSHSNYLQKIKKKKKTVYQFPHTLLSSAEGRDCNFTLLIISSQFKPASMVSMFSLYDYVSLQC